jgi:hypothetical protein
MFVNPSAHAVQTLGVAGLQVLHLPSHDIHEGAKRAESVQVRQVVLSEQVRHLEGHVSQLPDKVLK